MSLFPTVEKPSVEVAGWPRGKVHQQLVMTGILIAVAAHAATLALAAHDAARKVR
jgi:hypothetical protein